MPQAGNVSQLQQRLTQTRMPNQIGPGQQQQQQQRPMMQNVRCFKISDLCTYFQALNPIDRQSEALKLLKMSKKLFL